nr:immunoglobulin heavy chain junction region [Mus musculus]NSM06882.1 immunoglobulin heavy chain junction region [Mus musculus]NSM08487.1 immunoglobulin heavy chain junction region [Mus musculus]NSM08552.1 immunoglobulin heavy chain junction region [Mus musculus]
CARRGLLGVNYW